MDWVNERYVRLYVRDSADWVMLPWQARTVFYELLRKVDRAGVLEVGKHGIRALPDLLRLPAEVVQVGVNALIEDGCVSEVDGRIVLKNYLEAQECRQADAQRKRESRERHRSSSLSGTLARGTGVSPAVTEIPTASPAVTSGHTDSESVTAGHADSISVTPCLAVPCLAKPSQGIESLPAAPPEGLALAEGTDPGITPRPRKRKPGLAGASPEERAVVERVLARLSERAGRSYSPEAHAKLVLRLLRDGHTENDLRLVIWDRANDWVDDPKMDYCVRPSTLFGPEGFAEKLAHAKAAWDAGERDDAAKKHKGEIGLGEFLRGAS